MQDNKPTTPEELAKALETLDVEIDVRGISDDDAGILALFLTDNNFLASWHDGEDMEDVIRFWGREYGIITSGASRHLGANRPDRKDAAIRLTIQEVMKILLKCQNITEEDFNAVF